MRVLIDTNVVVDVLQQREPWAQAGNRIFLSNANHLITGCLTAKELTDIYYFARKQFRGMEDVDKRARNVIENLMGLFEIIDTLSEDCRNAVAIKNNDYEDAVMIASAQRAEVDCIVTRNSEHYAAAQIPVYSPDSFLAVLEEH